MGFDISAAVVAESNLCEAECAAPGFGVGPPGVLAFVSS